MTKTSLLNSQRPTIRFQNFNPSDAEAWNNKGAALGSLGRYDEALNAFDEATTISLTYAEAWYNMGIIYDFKGNLGTSIQAYKIATQIDPSNQKAL